MQNLELQTLFQISISLAWTFTLSAVFEIVLGSNFMKFCANIFNKSLDESFVNFVTEEANFLLLSS